MIYRNLLPDGRREVGEHSKRAIASDKVEAAIKIFVVEDVNDGSVKEAATVGFNSAQMSEWQENLPAEI